MECKRDDGHRKQNWGNYVTTACVTINKRQLHGILLEEKSFLEHRVN